MRNRWFHKPELHSPPPGMEKKASWLELFYDLIFVASFIQLGNGLSKHIDAGGVLVFIVAFVPLWVSWTGFAYYMNRFNVDDFLHRIMVFIQMFAVGAMAISAPNIFEGDYKTFACAYAIAQFMVTIMYIRTYKQIKEGRAFSIYWGTVFFIGGLIWLLSIFVPWPWMYVCWILGVAAIFISPFSKQSRALAEEFPGDNEHLSERFGLLTLIVLGESFVKVLSELTGDGAELHLLFQAFLLLLLTCCIWWIYFDDVAGSTIRGKRFTPIIWLYAHIPLQMSITTTGIGIKKAVFFELSNPAPDKYRWLLAGSLALTFFSVALIDSVTERHQAELSDKARVYSRFFAGLLVLLLAPAGSAMSGELFLILITVISVAQVIFDMMMAPLEAATHHPHAVTSPGETHQQEGSARTTNAPKRRGIPEAVRKGTPSALRQDLYFFFMEGSWMRFLGSLFFLYLILNLFFAALFVLKPESIGNARPNSFADAFFFSVQTMSTIGFGTLSPATLYGDILVTVEAAIGLLGVALATGLMFAKVSRPKANVVFSNNALIIKHFGQPTLLFRAGNARGNEVVDASITCTALIEEVSPEGETMKRLHDLELVRKTSPLFTLSWNVMHVITEDGPLAHIDWNEPEKHMDGIVVTMVGHDGTYGQTVYARHMYHPEQILTGYRFGEFTDMLPDGRILMDYTRFHNIEKEEV